MAPFSSCPRDRCPRRARWSRGAPRGPRGCWRTPPGEADPRSDRSAPHRSDHPSSPCVQQICDLLQGLPVRLRRGVQRGDHRRGGRGGGGGFGVFGWNAVGVGRDGPFHGLLYSPVEFRPGVAGGGFSAATGRQTQHHDRCQQQCGQAMRSVHNVPP